MEENGRSNIFRDKETKNKVQVIFLDIKVRTETWQLHFWTRSTNKQGSVYLFSAENLKKKAEKRSTIVRKLEATSEWWFLTLKSKNIAATDAIAS